MPSLLFGIPGDTIAAIAIGVFGVITVATFGVIGYVIGPTAIPSLRWRPGSSDGDSLLLPAGCGCSIAAGGEGGNSIHHFG